MDIITLALAKKQIGKDTTKAVSDYLDEHLTNPTNPPLDTSLEIAGAAADSKATGDKLSELKEGLNAVSAEMMAVIDGSDVYINVGFEYTNGYRIYKNGNVLSVYGASTTYGYTEFVPLTIGKTYRITPKSGIKYYYYNTDADAFDETMTHVDQPVGWSNAETDISPRYPYLCISYYKEDGTAIGDVKGVSISEKKDNVYAKKTDILTDLFPQSAFEQGTLVPADGGESSNNYRIRTKDTYKAVIDFTLSNKTGYTVAIFYYADNGTYIESTGFPATDATATYNISAGDNIRIVVSKYPLAITGVDSYVGLTCSPIYTAELIGGEIANINTEIDARYNAYTASVKDSAVFAKTEKLSYYAHPYYVGKDKDYQTINDALAQWATDGYPDAVVYIANGEYNETVFVEDHNIAFIGESKEGTIIRTKTGAYSYPPFKIHHGNVLVANLTAIADHSANADFVYDTANPMAYAFHIDGGSVGGVVHVKNCIAISHQCSAFGMGTIPNSRVRLENVDAYSYTASDAGLSLTLGAILLHTASTALYPTVGTENIDMINVRAYAENTEDVITFNNSNSTNPLGIKSISVMTVSGVSNDRNALVHLPNHYTIDPTSCGNTCNKLDAV